MTAPLDRKRIAVIGGGISGLVCAWVLARRHQVTLFEANDYVGGHTNTVDVERADGTHAVDTGFIVYNEWNYPGFSRLLRILEVETQPTSMSFSVRCDRTGLEYNGTSLNRLFAQRRNLVRPRFLRMIRDILRFNRDARESLENGDCDATVAEWLAARGYGGSFVEHYLVPMGSALWSTPPGVFREFPIRFVLEFLENHSMLDLKGRPEWRVIRGGSREYVKALTRSFADRIRLSTPVRAVRRTAAGVVVTTDGAGEETFDEVVFACHSDQALRMLTDPSTVETEVLGAIPYQANETVLHTDESILPKNRLARASWNYHLPRDEPDRATVTYDMNDLQTLTAEERFCVTLNETDRLDPTRILRRFSYEHPVFSARRDSAQQRHEELIRSNRTSFCGAYWGYGFHEDGVRSALAVCHAFGEELGS